VNSKQYRFTPKQVADNLLLLARHYEALGCGKESGFACPASDAAAVLFAAERLITPPTLTYAEREAIETAIATLDAYRYPTLPAAAATIRKLLERME
jgi:hypothetical protein